MGRKLNTAVDPTCQTIPEWFLDLGEIILSIILNLKKETPAKKPMKNNTKKVAKSRKIQYHFNR